MSDPLDRLDMNVDADDGIAAPLTVAALLSMALDGDLAEARFWRSIADLEAAERWADVAAVLDKREFELDPWRLAPCRVRVLIAEDWRERALECLLKAYADGYIRADEAVDSMLASGALFVAASFVDQALSGDPWQSRARATVLAAVARLCMAVGPEEAALQYADAIQARAILAPGGDAHAEDAPRTRAWLACEGARLLKQGDMSRAARWLTAATRFPPPDRAMLESLADAALQAGLRDRYLDTLIRIWAAWRDTDVLSAMARGALDSSSWSVIAEVMAMVTAEVAVLGLDLGAVTRAFHEQARRKLDEFILAGDITGGMELVVALIEPFPIGEWPADVIARLLRSAKRRLRDQKVGVDVLAVSMGALYLAIEPNDPDVCRMVARVSTRQRRWREARDLLQRVVRANPHGAADWAALAIAHHELRDFDEGKACAARAVVISPGVPLPPALSPFPAMAPT